MIVDETILSRGEVFDVVVIGAGPAGLTLAQSLATKRLRVLIVEAGGAKDSRLAREDCRGTLAESEFFHPSLDTYRVRALGGTSRIWGGRCIPYDPIDFAERPWIAGPGWPIAYESVARYYPAAMDAAEAGRFDNDPATALPEEAAELVPGLDGDAVHTTLERFSRPTNFWRRYGPELAASNRMHLLANTVVTAIRLRENGHSVDHVDVVGPSGKPHALRAGAFVLASGGLEVTRLLLASNDVQPSGISNESDQLGRNYMSHLCATASVARFTPSSGMVAGDYSRDADGIYVRRRLCLTDVAQRTHALANTTFRTHLPDPGDPTHGDGILSAMFLAKSFVQREYAAKLGAGAAVSGHLPRHVGNVLRNPVRLARFADQWARKRILSNRKLPSVALASPTHLYHLEFHAEQEPNATSRVSLSNLRDRWGVPRLNVDWRPTEADIDRVQRAHVLLAGALAQSGTGTLTFEKDVIASEIRRTGVVGGHHIGTTRMAVNPRDGVVDTECRVHGTDNLYIASASVLPTSGQANPTLTVLALSLRLADHLAARGALASAARAA